MLLETECTGTSKGSLMKVYVSNINPGNEALKFIDARLLDDGYRGNWSSQHNRYTMEKVVKILRLFDKYAPDKRRMAIRTTDLSKRPENTPDERIYAQFCNDCKLAVGIGTQDAMRKNIFVDLHRMGLIVRYDAARYPIDPLARRKVKYVSLSDQGMKLIKAGKIEVEFFIFSKGVDKLLGGYISVLLDLLRDTELQLKNVTIYEFMFFVSAIGTEASFNIGRRQCIDLIKSYRSLSRIQRHSVVEVLKDKLKPENYSGSKTAKRDFHNWYNKAEQVYSILHQTVYFEVQDKKLVLKQGRSSNEKSRYFRNHKIKKALGFELHHVVPLGWSENEYQFKLLDKWENMVYIDGFSHAKITQNRNRNVVMTANEDDLMLSDYNENQIYLENRKNILYSTNKQNIMLDYNRQLLNIVD